MNDHQVQALITGLTNQLNVNMKETLSQVLAQVQTQGPPTTSDKSYNNSKWHEEVPKQLEIFEGDSFVEWQFKLRSLVLTYAGRETVDAMDTARKWEDPVKEQDYAADVKALYIDLSAKLYNILATKTKGDAYVMMRNVPDMNGLEAYRRLCHRFDSKTIGKRVTLIRKVVNPTKVKHLKDVNKMIENWEETIRILTTEYDEEKLSEGLKMGILLEMVPTQLTEMLMSMLPDPKKDDDAYAKTKELIMQMVEHKTEFQKPTPMDVGAFNPNDKQDEVEEPEQWLDDLYNVYTKGNGKGNGKGKGKGCWNCGEPGHRRFECPYPLGAQESAGKGWPQDTWTKGNWSKGNREKGGKSWNSKGGFGKGQSGKWGGFGGYVQGKGWNSKGKGGKGDGKTGVQTYGLDDVGHGSDDWSLAICHLDRRDAGNGARPDVLHPAGNKHDHLNAYAKWDPEKQPTLTANLADFIKFKSSKPSPPVKPAVFMVNRFSVLEDEDEMEEILLEDGTLVQEIKADIGKNVAPPPEQVFKRPARRGRSLKESVHQTGCGCCVSDAKKKTVRKEGDADQDEDLILGAFFDKHEPIHSLSEPKWVDIEVVMDSGAAESVAPSAVAPWVRIKESIGSREGREYLSASGDVLKNLGEKELSVVTCEGFPATTTFQIADVTRPLCSIAKVCDKGNRVIFEKDCGYVEDQWGTRSYFERKGNIYTMNFYALDTGNQVSVNQPEGFQRQSE